MNKPYRLFAWNYSYFSSKVRSYMTFKEHYTDLEFEEVLATSEVLDNYVVPATGSRFVPQVECQSGEWLQDSSAIIDRLEVLHPETPVIPSGAKQRCASYMIELLADEWMLPWAFWERWYYSAANAEPNHEAFNALQWGRMFNDKLSGKETIAAGRAGIDILVKSDDVNKVVNGPYDGLLHLGVTPKTQDAWTDSMHGMLCILEAHFDVHDYILGGAPTLADFSLMGPLHPHVYKDPVSGFMLRTQYPLVAEWIERTNGSVEAGYRSYKEPRYDLVDGSLVPLPQGNILPDDEVPETLLPLLQVFFDEMMPVLNANIEKVTSYIESGAFDRQSPMPGKSFYSEEKYKHLQTEGGPLELDFEIRGVQEKRMGSPYQVWMLRRIADALSADTLGPQDYEIMTGFVRRFNGGQALLDLRQRLEQCPIEKRFESLYAA